MYYPDGIAVDGAGNIYVQSRNPESLVKLSPSGAPLAQWQAPAGYDGMDGNPGVDAQGNVYVTVDSGSTFAITGPPMIVKLSPSLQVLTIWQ
jgi:hypothetical protein